MQTLTWLAYLLTGSHDASVVATVEAAAADEHGSEYFSEWMDAWSRRVVIAKALAAVRDELDESADRTRVRSTAGTPLPSGGWMLDGSTDRADLERALLAIDILPRAALVLSVFERVPLADAAILLDVDPKLFKKAQAIGLRELTGNLARMQGWSATAARPFLVFPEVEHA